jgi:tetratricopeptide (TPR) repeat protein
MARYLPRSLIAVCFLLLAFARASQADTASTDPAERSAKRHYDRGQKLFGLQKFDEALDEYQKAYDAKPIPAFLFNIGQCQRNLGDYEAAIFSFKRYLKLDPEAENKEQVEELIDELETKKAEGDTEHLGLGKRKKPVPDEEPPPKETEDGSPVYKKWWFWTAVAVVAVGGGVGIYYATKSSGGPPSTDLGHIDYPK